MRGTASTRLLKAGDRTLDVRIYVANTFASRFLGLMGTRDLPNESGLLLVDCPQVHCCFMRYPLGVVYFDEHFNALEAEVIRPWRLGKKVKGAQHVLEVSVSFLQSVDATQLRIEDEERK